MTRMRHRVLHVAASVGKHPSAPGRFPSFWLPFSGCFVPGTLQLGSERAEARALTRAVLLPEPPPCRSQTSVIRLHTSFQSELGTGISESIASSTPLVGFGYLLLVMCVRLCTAHGCAGAIHPAQRGSRSSVRAHGAVTKLRGLGQPPAWALAHTAVHPTRSVCRLSYACNVLSKANPVASYSSMAVFSLLAVGLALMTTFGFAFLIGLPWFNQALVLLLLLMGLGIDDTFIMVNFFFEKDIVGAGSCHPQATPWLGCLLLLCVG